MDDNRNVYEKQFFKGRIGASDLFKKMSLIVFLSHPADPVLRQNSRSCEIVIRSLLF